MIVILDCCLLSLHHSIRWAVALYPPHQSDSKIVHPSAQPAPDWENNLQPASFHTHYLLPLHASSRLLQAACGESISQRETRSQSAKWGTMTPFLKTWCSHQFYLQYNSWNMDLIGYARPKSHVSDSSLIYYRPVTYSLTDQLDSTLPILCYHHLHCASADKIWLCLSG